MGQHGRRGNGMRAIFEGFVPRRTKARLVIPCSVPSPSCRSACLPACLSDIIFDSYGIVSPLLSYFCNPRLICPTCVIFLKSEVISIHMTCVSLSIVPKGLLKLGGFEAFRVHKALIGQITFYREDRGRMPERLPPNYLAVTHASRTSRGSHSSLPHKF